MKPVLSRPHIKQTSCIQQSNSWKCVKKLFSHNWRKRNLYLVDISNKQTRRLCGCPPNYTGFFIYNHLICKKINCKKKDEWGCQHKRNESGPQFYLSSFQKRWSRGRFNCISTFACKGTVCVEVLASSSFPHFFSFVNPASLWRAESSRSQLVYRKLFSHGRHSSKNNFLQGKISQLNWTELNFIYSRGSGAY